MFAKTHSFVLIGIDPIACEVEVDTNTKGLNKTLVVNSVRDSP